MNALLLISGFALVAIGGALLANALWADMTGNPVWLERIAKWWAKR